MNPKVMDILPADADGLAQAAQILGTGGLVAFPTETVYGLGADARDGGAVARIYEAKGRPSFNPLIVHVADLAAARGLAAFDDTATRLADAFWPGPLTLVVPLLGAGPVSPLVTAGLSSVAIRVPAHPVARALLEAFDGPLAAPSANPSGKISPTQAAHVAGGLEGRIDALLDGGACDVGLESSIVACLPDQPVAMLREGGLPREAIEACLGQSLHISDGTPDAPNAPGQLMSHYAPEGQVRLNVTTPQDDEVLLGFGAVEATLNLSPSGDLTEAAAALFGHLHRLDAMGARRIAVSPIPEKGIGRAINDRLRRAAAPR